MDKVLKRSNTLKELHLHSNIKCDETLTIDDECCEILAEALMEEEIDGSGSVANNDQTVTTTSSSSLTLLHLGECNIGVAGCIALSKMIQNNSKLEKLCVDVKIIPTGLEPLHEAMKQNLTLCQCHNGYGYFGDRNSGTDCFSKGINLLCLLN